MSHHLSPKVKVQLTAICSHLCSPAITHFSLCRSGNVSFERQNVKGQKKNSNISQGDFNTAAYLEGSQWEWLLLEGIGRCSWFTDMVLLSLGVQNKVLANWPAGMWKWEPHLSVLTAGWQLLMDLQNQRLAWQPRLADELWNETDIQKLQAAQTMPPLPLPRPLIPSSPPPPRLASVTVMAAATRSISIFHNDSGNLGWSDGHCRDTSTSLGTFNDRLWTSTTLSFLLIVVHAALKWPKTSKIQSRSPKNDYIYISYFLINFVGNYWTHFISSS